MRKMSVVFRLRVVINFVLISFCLSLIIVFSGLRTETTSHAQEEIVPTTVRFLENFDSVSAPALPAGWTTSRTGINQFFVTTTVSADTPPNALYTGNPATAGSSEITSPNISLGNTRARLTFRHSYVTEFRRGYDGGVLEISVNGGAFQDILAAGATFAGGGYIQTLNPDATGNPLLGRQVWTGDSVGYATTIVDLPLSLANQSVRFRWLYGTNNSFEGIGWRIDRVMVEDLIPSITRYQENFDSVTAPALPPGWTTEQTDPVRSFRIQTENWYTQPNSIFAPAPAAAGTAAIISPTIKVGSNSPKLIFQHYYLTNQTGEGGVLEISIDGGPFQDILAAGGSFAYGEYNDKITAQTNPLVNRKAWTGATLGFIITEVNLPPTAYRQNVRFKWLFATDAVILSIGWWIDSVRVTESLAGENLNAIAIPASGVAQPYPAEIQVANQVGLITHVQVNLMNFNHASPDDVDLMLVAPSGRKVVLMSDVGGSNAVSNLSLSFEDEANGSLPDEAQLVSGNYRPANFEPVDNFPAPAPVGPPTGNTLGVLNGTDANGAWQLFLVDDSGNNAGNISGGWSLDVQTSLSAIAIPESGTAQPYPAEFTVSGLPGAVSKVTVNLTNFSHTAPDDVDLMLVAPNGRRVVVMSDVGGGTEVGSLNLTIDDDAPLSLPDTEALVSGVFKPTNFEPGDSFPSPAPQGEPNGATLNAFFGSGPNGVWKLYVVDDTGGNFGTLAGSFSVTIQSSLGVCQFSLSNTVQAFPLAGGVGNFGIIIPTTCPWEVSAQSDFLTINSSATGEGNATVNFSVAPNTDGARSGRISIASGSLTRTFTVQQGSGCPLSTAQSSVNFGASGGAGNVHVTAGASCGWIGQSNSQWIQITSAQQIGDGNLTFTVQPNTTLAARTGTITVGPHQLVINQARVSAKRFDFDGDARADLSVFRTANATWYVWASQTNSLLALQFGLATDKLVPADYDGDGKTDIAVFRDGNWYLLQSSDNAFRAVQFGLAGDLPVPADYTGDGRDEIAVYRAGAWHIFNLANNQFQFVQFGISSDKPVPADFDGDGRTDVAIYRDGTWYWMRSSDNSLRAVQFGTASDKPVVGHYDGDGHADQAVYRGGVWYVLGSMQGFYAVQFGINNDVPVAADYDGDGKTDVAVFREGVWYVLQSSNNQLLSGQWGEANDRPVPAAFVP